MDLLPRSPKQPKSPKPRLSSGPEHKATPKRQKPQRSPLASLGLDDPRFALLCAPSTYLDCRHPINVITADAIDVAGTVFALRFTGQVKGFNASKAVAWTIPSAAYPDASTLGWRLMKATRRIEIELIDDAGASVFLSSFGDFKQWLPPTSGEAVFVLGQLQQFGRRLFLSCDVRLPAHAVGQVWARYARAPRLSGHAIEELVLQARGEASALLACRDHILEATGIRETELLSACSGDSPCPFASISELLTTLHHPVSVDRGWLALEFARRVSALGVQAAAVRRHRRPESPHAPLDVDMALVSTLGAGAGVALTADQIDVIHKVALRLRDTRPLTALLSGDVGTGKTLAFTIPAIAAHLCGARVAIIAPRTLLADQIAQQILQRFGHIVTNLERIEAGGRINDPAALLVGTQGLASVARACNWDAQFLVIDEQHKSGTDAREAMMGPSTHVLEVSATPVPRSLAASLYEGMELLNLRQCPVDKTIVSQVLDMGRRGEVIAGIRAALAAGDRAAVVYPQVLADTEDAGDAQLAAQNVARSVEDSFASLNEAFPGQAVMLHGAMTDEAVRANLALLRSGARRLVVASTVLEIGIDVPAIRVMVVREAERFGISQLHQLRGRLARDGGRGDFIMVVDDLDAVAPDALERLHAVARTTDGYELAEIDLLKRGFGEVDGQAQSGSSSTIFRLVKLRPGDFVARRLRSLGAAALSEAAPTTRRRVHQAVAPPGQPVQVRLL